MLIYYERLKYGPISQIENCIDIVKQIIDTIVCFSVVGSSFAN